MLCEWNILSRGPNERVEAYAEGESMKVIADRLWVKVVERETGDVGHPIPPLSALFDNNGQPEDFVRHIEFLVQKQDVPDVAAMIHKFANQRNLLLYASKSKLPTLRDDVDVTANIDRNARQVLQLLTAYLLIDQWPERQAMVQQIVNAMVTLVPQLRPKQKRPSDDDLEYVI